MTKPIYIDNELMLSEEEIDKLVKQSKRLGEELTSEQVLEMLTILSPEVKGIFKSLTVDQKADFFEKNESLIKQMIKQEQHEMRELFTKLSVLKLELQHARDQQEDGQTMVRFLFPTKKIAREFLDVWTASLSSEYLATAMVASQEEDDKALYCQSFELDHRSLTIVGKPYI